MILDEIITSQNKPVSSNECKNKLRISMMMIPSIDNNNNNANRINPHHRLDKPFSKHQQQQQATASSKKRKIAVNNNECCSYSSSLVLCEKNKRKIRLPHNNKHQQNHRFVPELIETKSAIKHRKQHRESFQTLLTTRNHQYTNHHHHQHRRIVFDSSSSTKAEVIMVKSNKRRRIISDDDDDANITPNHNSLSSSSSSSSTSSMKRQFAQADLSRCTAEQINNNDDQISVFSTQNKYLFNSTCSSCLALNCDYCCRQFQLNETIASTKPLAKTTSNNVEKQPKVKSSQHKTPFDATFSEFLSSTPIVRGGASTSTRRVRSIFAIKSAKNTTSSSSSPTKKHAKKSKSSRLDKIARTASNLFFASTNNLVNANNYVPTNSVHNTNDNFKNFGDFLVWYV